MKNTLILFLNGDWGLGPIPNPYKLNKIKF